MGLPPGHEAALSSALPDEVAGRGRTEFEGRDRVAGDVAADLALLGAQAIPRVAVGDPVPDVVVVDEPGGTTGLAEHTAGKVTDRAELSAGVVDVLGADGRDVER